MGKIHEVVCVKPSAPWCLVPGKQPRWEPVQPYLPAELPAEARERQWVQAAQHLWAHEGIQAPGAGGAPKAWLGSFLKAQRWEQMGGTCVHSGLVCENDDGALPRSWLGCPPPEHCCWHIPTFLAVTSVQSLSLSLSLCLSLSLSLSLSHTHTHTHYKSCGGEKELDAAWKGAGLPTALVFLSPSSWKWPLPAMQDQRLQDEPAGMEGVCSGVRSTGSRAQPVSVPAQALHFKAATGFGSSLWLIFPSTVWTSSDWREA